MNRRFLIFAGVALAVVVAFAAFGFWGNADWGTHSEITRAVPGQNGETLIIQEGGRNGFFPFFPFFLVFPLFWIFVVGGFFALFGRRRWGGGPPFAPEPQNRQAWLNDWHQQQHAVPVDATVTTPEDPGQPQS